MQRAQAVEIIHTFGVFYFEYGLFWIVDVVDCCAFMNIEPYTRMRLCSAGEAVEIIDALSLNQTPAPAWPTLVLS